MIMADLDQRGPDVPLTLGVGRSAEGVAPEEGAGGHYRGHRLLETAAEGPDILGYPPAHQLRLAGGRSPLE